MRTFRQLTRSSLEKGGSRATSCRTKTHSSRSAAADAPAPLGPDEEALQALLPEPAHRSVRIEPCPRNLEGLLAEVRAEDQDRVRGDADPGVLDERHGQRVDLLAGGAPHHPAADGRSGGLVPEDLRERDLPQLVEAPLVPEERGDLDEEVLVERLDLGRVLAQQLQVRGHVLRLPDRHAPGQAPLEGRRLVLAEVDAGRRPHERDDLCQVGGSGLHRRRRLAAAEIRVAGQPGQLGAERRQGQAEVDHAGVDRVLRHLAGARRARVLREGDPALLPDRRQPGGAVRGGPGEDHADGLPAALGRERSQEEVDGEVRPVLVFLERGEPQRALLDRHLDAGWDDVHPVRLDPRALLGLRDLHLGRPGERVAQQARPRRLEVLHQDERQPGVGRHVGEELPEGVQPAGRGAHADHGEGRRSRAPGGWHGAERTRPAELCGWSRAHGHVVASLGRRLWSRRAAQAQRFERKAILLQSAAPRSPGSSPALRRVRERSRTFAGQPRSTRLPEVGPPAASAHRRGGRACLRGGRCSAPRPARTLKLWDRAGTRGPVPAGGRRTVVFASAGR